MAKEVKMNITKFLGLWHDNAGDTAIPNGALSQMQNFQILNGYKLRKRSGYTSLLDTPFWVPNQVEIIIPAGRMAGDINGDGAFTQADYDLLNSEDYFGKTVTAESSIELKCADVNNNGAINIHDISALSDISGGKARTTYSRDILGVWTAREDLTTTPTVYEDYVFYTDIPINNVVYQGDISIAIDGTNDIGLYATANISDGVLRVFSKLIPIADRTAKITATKYSPDILTSPSPIRGQWYGKIKGKYYHVVVTGGKIYVITNKYKTEIGSITDAPTHMFQFGQDLYIQNGIEYYKFSGDEEINPDPVSFDSRTAGVNYPYTTTIPAGRYEIELRGGKAKDITVSYTDGVDRWKETSYGGKGGIVRFVLSLDSQSNVEIKHITNGDAGDCYALYVNTVLCAVAGGGGMGALGRSGGSGNWNYQHYDGADGGGLQGNSGANARDGKGGTQTSGGLGGVGNNGTGGNGNKYDHATEPGKGGSGYGTGAYYGREGGCGYCGGGGGGYDSGSTYNRGGIGGGGSSYILNDPDIIIIENSKGTHTGNAFITYQATKLYDTAIPVDGYIPKTYVGTKPDGTDGTKLEPINMLTGKRRQLFNGDNTATVYKLAEKSNVSVDKVLVGGVEQTIATHYTVNATKDEVTFTSGNIPPVGINNVEIYYTHDNNTDRAEAVKYTHARIYGGKNDNRVFLYGNGNRVIFSDLADGVPSAEYFPVFNTMDIGSPQYDVTGLSVQYDRMLIHKERGTWWTHYDYDSTLMTANFPVYPLNDNVGVSYKGTEQIIENNPFVLMNKQLWQFVASNVRDERNVQYMSEKVETLLEQLDFANVMTLDYERFGEYWIILDNRVYIYNYRLGVWYYYYLADNVTAVCIKDNQVVLGTDTGNLLAMDGSLDDNGVLINAFAETGWLDYGYSNMQKFLNFMWVQIFPESNTSVQVHYQLDRTKPYMINDVKYNAITLPNLIKEIGYENVMFDDMDFADFSFLTNYNPKSFRLKPKAKKFNYIKFTFINDEKSHLTLLGLNAPALLGGNSK